MRRRVTIIQKMVTKTFRPLPKLCSTYAKTRDRGMLENASFLPGGPDCTKFELHQVTLSNVSNPWACGREGVALALAVVQLDFANQEFVQGLPRER